MASSRLVGLALLCTTAAALAAPVDPSLFQELNWRSIGPFRAGRVLAVAGVPGEREHFYFGAVNGGVWETLDAGRTWQPIFDGQPIGSIGAIALAPSDPRVIYVGTGEADMRSDIAQGVGMFKSSDGGRSWKQIGLSDSQQIGRILVDPADPNRVFVAALGHPYGPNAERGVFRSVDGGARWQKVLGKDQDTGAVDLAFEPGKPAVIYAALWQTRRTPWSVYPPSNGPGSGLFKSSDGGDTWQRIDGHGLPEQHGRIGIALAPSQPQRVYAMVDAEAGGLYRSDDGGAHWQRQSDDNRIWQRGWYFGGVAVNPRVADEVYAANTNLYRSSDGGKTFAPVKGAPGGDDYHELWFDPKDPARRILGGDQGAVVTLNGGATWSSWFNQPTGQFYHVATDSRFPYWVYGAQQDSGAAGVPSRTTTLDGINLTHFRETVAGGESDNVAPDPKDPDVIYGGRVERYDLRTEQTRIIDPTIAYPDQHRRTWTLPLVFSRRDPGVLYFANQRVYRTADGGSHWDAISPDLTREDPGTPANLDAATVAVNTGLGPRRGVVYAIAPSRLADHELWVGTDDGLIWRSRDEGAHWQDVTPKALTPWSKVGIIETSHFDADTAYAAVDRHRLDDVRPYVYRTHDGGRSWTLIANGIPAGSFVNAVREDSVRKGLLFAGTERGVFVSFDDGGQWQSLQRNLPVTSVRDLELHGDDLVIATHGRAFWILDDISPLRQLDAAPASAPAALFEPAIAYRLRPLGFAGTPMPKDEAMAPNPPEGANLDYRLDARPAKPVSLEIRDAQGAIVVSRSSDEAAPKIDLGKITTTPEWLRTHSRLSAEPGMHRFTWSMRYAVPAALDQGGNDRNNREEGVWAPPGRYQVVLSVDGKRYERTLTLAPDPRIDLPAAAYAEQFALAREIEQSRAALALAWAQAEAALKGITERRQGASSEVSAALARFEARVRGVTGTVASSNPTNAWWRPAQSLRSMRYCGESLERLQDAVELADAAPSPDARAGFAKLGPATEAVISDWHAISARELPALNEKLEAAGLKAISLEQKPSGG